MAIIKEWHCGACGLEFDSGFPVCGRCGATEPYVTRAFRTAPGFIGDQTKRTDTSLLNFTQQYGLSDFSNNQSTKHEKDLSSTWHPTSDLVNDPSLVGNKGEAALIKSLIPEAAKPVTSKKIIVGREKNVAAAR